MMIDNDSEGVWVRWINDGATRATATPETRVGRTNVRNADSPCDHKGTSRGDGACYFSTVWAEVMIDDAM
jgi:hypothetical protein